MLPVRNKGLAPEHLDMAHFLGEALERFRRRAGMTLQDVADVVGTPRSTVLRWERGEFAPRGPDLAKLIRLFQLEADEQASLLAAARRHV